MTKKSAPKFPVQVLSNEELKSLEEQGSFEFHKDEVMMSFDTQLEKLVDYSKMAFTRFEQENLIADNTIFPQTRYFHILRRNLALAIYSKTIAQANLLYFKNKIDSNVEFETTNESINIVKLTDDLLETTEKVEVLKLKAQIKLGADSEYDFLQFDEFYRPTKKKYPTRVYTTNI
ncbi:hypothetical protein ACXM5X_31720 [Pseudomonas saponiphila]